MKSTFPRYFLRAEMRGEYFVVFFTILLSQPKSLQKSISTRMRVRCVLLNEVGSGEGEPGISLT